MRKPLISTGRLRELLDDPRIAIVDCRWRLGEPGAGQPLWREGHIPGAAFLDLDRDLAAPPGDGGRHPLPSAEAFQASARRAGIRADSLVVAYDEAGEGGAARLWWLLHHFGHDNVTVLDGGLRAWREEGGELRAGKEEIEPGDFTAARPRDDIVSAEELRAGSSGDRGGGGAHRVLLDARAAERFRGEVEPVDPVAGHIPGAVNVPFAELAPGGRFLPPDELRARLEAAGVGPCGDAVAYCGSGVTAAVAVLAAEVAGIGPVRLYPGSWSEWCGRGLPVERG
ncbi:MAG TPA: sulfurtransferase [Thermoleophilaceae bacterium]|nr:sulfurtransferase [Thermoleophilaceae bacterium]